jgi:psiF repeat
MSRHSHPVLAVSLLLATSLIPITAARTAQAAPAQSSTASAQDKARACNDRADKKDLKGSDRQTFMQNCLNKAADTGSSPNVSQQDKAKTCNNLADRKNLTGSDRRSFVKDCMKRANP